jgi:hypothetical protein
MQREKLYYLHKIAYFAVALLVFKTDKILCDLFLILRTRSFMSTQQILFIAPSANESYRKS